MAVINVVNYGITIGTSVANILENVNNVAGISVFLACVSAVVVKNSTIGID